MKNFINIIVFSVLIATINNSCVKKDDYDVPEAICVENQLEVNTSIPEVKSLYQGELFQITGDLIVEGYVISNDSTGNIYGGLYVQDSPKNPTNGLLLELDRNDLYLFYPVGQKILIKLKGLYLENDDGTFKLGGIFSAYGTKMVGRLPSAKIKEHVFASCETAKAIQPKTYTINQLDSTLTNTLVKIDQIEFDPESLCKPFAEEGETTYRTVQDCEGNTIKLKNSGYSDFQQTIVPITNGSITGILTKERNDFVLTIRSLNDLDFDQPRCGGIEYFCEPPPPNATLQDIKDAYQEQPTLISKQLKAEVNITANDVGGNFYKELFVQDETGGMKILVDETKLHEKGFVLNGKMVLAAYGLTLDKIHGMWVLGNITDNKLSGIEEEDFYRYFYLQDEIATINSLTVEVEKLSEENLGSLVEIPKVQFKEESTFVEGGKNTDHQLTDCFANELTLPISKRFVEGEKQLPDGNGSIRGVLTYNNGYQLRIRKREDVAMMSDSRCNVFDNATQVTIVELKNTIEGEPKTVEENIKIKGTIISDKTTQNFDENKAIFQDDTGGLQLVFDTPHELVLNSEVEVALFETEVHYKNGTLWVEKLTSENIITQKEDLSPPPKTITLDDLTSEEHFNQLVKIEGYQFENLNSTFTDMPTLTNCTQTWEVSVMETATFAGQQVPGGKGTVTGVLLPNRFYVRNVEDFQFDKLYEDCSLRYTSEHVLITEIADPNNNSTAVNARFIELYNSGDQPISLSRWELRRFTNDNVEYTERSVIDLSGFQIPPQNTFVIAADSLAFTQVYGFTPDMEGGTGGAAGSNGDDNIALIDGNGNIVDLFGVPGEDGSGTNHEFEDGKAVRNSDISVNNSTYTFSEWTIYNDTGDAGTVNQPQEAPQDFTPGIR